MRPLCDAFVGKLDGVAPSDELERRLEATLRKTQEAWPSVELEPGAFLEHLGGRLPPGLPPLEALTALHTSDLYLACACARGMPSAIRELERACFGLIDAEARRLRAAVEPEEIKQSLRTVFFIGREGREPAIARYSGEGPLSAWVRVSATRELLKSNDRQGRQRPLEDDDLRAALDTQADPELQHVRASYGAAFGAAFRQAMAELEQRERLVLRYHYVDGLSIDDLGRLFRVHRSTAARWISRARDELLARTREILKERLSVSGTELDSVMRVVGGNVDVSLRLLLSTKQPVP